MSGPSMWHEARKQEKKIRALIVDYRKRADRRREFYEKIKRDPTQFVRVNGRKAKIHLDPSVAIAAESPQSMMSWVGDSDVTIDRFDVRAHLDSIPENRNQDVELSEAEAEEERKCCYERYRILVQNECAEVDQKQCLTQIDLDETAEDRSAIQHKEEEKKKNSENKAAIGFTYKDSTPAASGGGDAKEDADKDSDNDSILSADEVDLDAVFDLDKLTQEQTQALNLCSTEYGMADDNFIECLWEDKEEAEELRMAKLMEEEKAQFSGRKSRRERRAFKDRRLQDKFKSSPPSYASRSSPKYGPYKRSPSRSKSRSRSPDMPERTMFITSFGGSDDEEGVVQGPMLPPHLQPKAKKTANSNSKKVSNKSPSVSSKDGKENTTNKGHSRSKSRGLRSRSRGRKSRSRSRGRRSRSRSRGRISTSRSQGRRSPSRSSLGRRSRGLCRSRKSRTRSPQRRSRSRGRFGRSRSPRRLSRSNSRFRSKSKSRSRSRRRSRSRDFSRRRGRFRSRTRSHSRSRSRSRSRRRVSKSYSRSRSRTRSSRSRSSSSSKSASPAKPVVKRYRRLSLESSDNSLSEDEDKNGKATSSSTASKYKQAGSVKEDGGNKSHTASKVSTGVGTGVVAKVTAADRLKKRMQAALNKQHKADKKKELDKIVKQEEERMDREEDLRNMAIQLRRREREKRHKEREELEVFEAANASVSKHKRSRRSRSRRSRSASSRSRSRSRHRRRKTRSRSRSPTQKRKRSPSPKLRKLVDY